MNRLHFLCRNFLCKKRVVYHFSEVIACVVSVISIFFLVGGGEKKNVSKLIVQNSLKSVGVFCVFPLSNEIYIPCVITLSSNMKHNLLQTEYCNIRFRVGVVFFLFLKKSSINQQDFYTLLIIQMMSSSSLHLL